LTHLILALDISKQFELICRRLSRICWTEAIKEAGNTKKVYNKKITFKMKFQRFCIFKMIGVLISKCNIGSENFEYLCSFFLPIIYREMSNSSSLSEEKCYLKLKNYPKNYF
jgi:hypothetical protein